LKLKLVVSRTWRIYAVCSDRGETFLDLLGRLTEKEEAKIAAVLHRVSEHGPRSIPTDRNHLVNEAERIWSLRISDHRILWMYDGGNTIICLHACAKKSNRLSPREVKAACTKKAEYLDTKRQGPIEIMKEENDNG
jgi:mRNA-degrading endonuclease RelE of RelBE toxin-antitoxin system